MIPGVVGRGSPVGSSVHPFAKQETSMWNFLIFRRMITPILIQILFWISEIAVVVEAIGRIMGAQGRPVQRMGLPMPMQAMNQSWMSPRTEGILLLIIGPVIVRIFYELLILVFRMNETLTDIRNNTAKPGMPLP
jgi:hypothetical protein